MTQYFLNFGIVYSGRYSQQINKRISQYQEIFTNKYLGIVLDDLTWMDVLSYSEVFFFSCSFTVNHIEDITSVQFPVFNNHLYNQNFQSWTFHSVTSLLLLGKKHSSANRQLITERLHC